LSIDPASPGYQVSQACDRKETGWFALAGLSALLCLAAGSVAQLSRRDGPDSPAPVGDVERDPVLT
jgi:hypothetical protein